MAIPGAGVKEQIFALKPEIIGKDPLQIDADLHRAGSAHRRLGARLMRGVSGIEMALWDLPGRSLALPVSTLLGGRFRDRVRVYDHAAPKNMLDPASCRDWAQKVKADPAGFTTHKFGFQHTNAGKDHARDWSNRLLTTAELSNIRKGWENCREAIGCDHDMMVHCHWEYDLRTSIQLSQAVESIKPVWLEDPMPPEYSESWKRLVGRLQRADLHRRESGAAPRLQGFHYQPGLRYPAPRSAQYRRISGDQTHRRYGGCVRSADGDAQHGQHRRNACQRAVGGIDSRLHRVRDDHGSGRLDGRYGAARRARSSKAELSLYPQSRGSGSS